MVETILPILGRTASIAGALYLVGERERLLRYTLAASVAVEGVLWLQGRWAARDVALPPPPAPTTLKDLAEQQKAMAYAVLKDKWTDADVFNTYLVISKRRLPVLLPDDFTDAAWGRKWLESTLSQAAAEAKVDAKDPVFREATLNFLNDVWAKLSLVASQSCAIAPDVCQTAGLMRVG